MALSCRAMDQERDPPLAAPLPPSAPLPAKGDGAPAFVPQLPGSVSVAPEPSTTGALVEDPGAEYRAEVASNPHKLTFKQRRFCREYFLTGNATLSAIRAGYSKPSAASIGSENLQKPEIQAELERLSAVELRRYDVTAGRVIGTLAQQAWADRRGFVDEFGRPVPLHELPKDLESCVEGVKVSSDGSFEIKTTPRRNALEALSKHVGLFEADHAQAGAAAAEAIAAREGVGDLEFARRLAWVLTRGASQLEQNA